MARQNPQRESAPPSGRRSPSGVFRAPSSEAENAERAVALAEKNLLDALDRYEEWSAEVASARDYLRRAHALRDSLRS